MRDLDSIVLISRMATALGGLSDTELCSSGWRNVAYALAGGIHSHEILESEFKHLDQAAMRAERARRSILRQKLEAAA